MKTERFMILGLLVAFASLAGVAAGAPERARPQCQIVDKMTETLLDADAVYLYRADIEDEGSVAFLELGTRVNLAYYRWQIGDIDARFELRGTWVADRGVINLPDQLLAARFPLTWIGRFDNGISTRVTVSPGYYGDGECLFTDALYMPVALSVARAFGKELSGVAGLEYRPDFMRKWFPVFGAVWQPSQAVRVEALLPRGGISLAAGRDWRLNLGYAWESLDYRIRDSRKQVNVEDVRFTLGVTRVLHSEISLTAEAGYVTERRLAFRNASRPMFVRDNDEVIRMPPDDRVNPDDAVFIRLAIAAPF